MDRGYLKALGARILAEANDLKRTPEALAREIGTDLAVVRAAIAGAADAAAARAIIQAMADTYPVSLADLWLEPDDTDHGVRLMSAADSEASSRVFERQDGAGRLTPYYEYRDTAMSRSAPFKPEWIAELRLVADADPADPDPANPEVAYNNGHLMHQTTFFIGPVNFYWEVGGRRRCAAMDTGDSNYITPFVPHSFTSRDPDRRGLIIAVTFAGAVRRALSEMGAVGAEEVADLAGDLRREDAFARRLKRHLDAESLDGETFADRLAGAGIDRARGLAIVGGEPPSAAEIDAIAGVLDVRPADLMVCRVAEAEEVVVSRRDARPARGYPAGNRPTYRLHQLARSRHQPLLKGFDVTVLGGGDGEMRHGLHEYVYNYGDQPCALAWNGDRRACLAPGDSAYVRPLVRHRFERQAGAEPARLLMIRVPGALTDPVLDELASFAPAGRDRAINETKQWF